MIDQKILKQINEVFGLIIVDTISVNSYFTRVTEVVSNKGEHFILKILPDFYNDNIDSYQAVIAVCDIIENDILELQTIKHIKAKDEKIVHKTEDGQFFVLMEKHEIVPSEILTLQKQQLLGHLMSIFHNKLKNFNHPNLGTTHWMRKIDDQGLKILSRDFPDKGFLPYVQFAHNINYEALNLSLTTIHGDWHKGNFSFTNPPFLFDYDTLSRGAAVEDIARTLTQWSMESSQRKDFHDNFIKGYGELNDNEIELIPKFMIAQNYANYIYFLSLADEINAQKSKESLPIIKALFNLD